MKQGQHQVTRLSFAHHRFDVCWAGLKSNVALPTKRYQIVQIVGFVDGIWDDVMDVEAATEVGLSDSAPLAFVAVPISGLLCGFLLFLPTAIVLGSAALPRWMATSAHVRGLPRGIAFLVAELRFIRAIRLKVVAAFSAFSRQKVIPATPAGVRAIPPVAGWIGLVFHIANDAPSNHALARRSRISTACVTAYGRTKSLALNWVEDRAASFAGTIDGLDLAASSSNRQSTASPRAKWPTWVFRLIDESAVFAGFFHRFNIRPTDNEYKPNIALRLDRAQMVRTPE